MVYHVLNRGVGRMRLFRKAADFAAKEQVSVNDERSSHARAHPGVLQGDEPLAPVARGCARMANVSGVLGWLTVSRTPSACTRTATPRVAADLSRPLQVLPLVQSDEHFLTVVRHIERNPLRAKMVEDLRDWQWSSLWRRCQADPAAQAWLRKWPVTMPDNWLKWVRGPQPEGELEAVRCSVVRGRPFGDDRWAQRTAKRFGLESTLPRVALAPSHSHESCR